MALHLHPVSDQVICDTASPLVVGLLGSDLARTNQSVDDGSIHTEKYFDVWLASGPDEVTFIYASIVFKSARPTTWRSPAEHPAEQSEAGCAVGCSALLGRWAERRGEKPQGRKGRKGQRDD